MTKKKNYFYSSEFKSKVLKEIIDTPKKPLSYFINLYKMSPKTLYKWLDKEGLHRTQLGRKVRNSYSKEFKQKVVEEVKNNPNKTKKWFAEKYKISKDTITDWLYLYESSTGFELNYRKQPASLKEKVLQEIANNPHIPVTVFIRKYKLSRTNVYEWLKKDPNNSKQKRFKAKTMLLKKAIDRPEGKTIKQCAIELNLDPAILCQWLRRAGFYTYKRKRK